MAKKATVQEFQQPPSTEIVIMAEALSVTESDELVQHEKTISRGLHTFTEVGEALQQIRDKRLYRTEFETFEGYCRLKWGMGRQYAYRLIGGAEVAGNLVSSIGDTALPAKEAHTRELAKLAPEAQPVAWLKAVQAAGSAEAVTAGHVSRAVDEVLGKVGRFDPNLYYAVDAERAVVYEQGHKEWNGGRNHPLREFGWLTGKRLNDSKEFDGYQVAPIPTLDVPPIADKLPGINVKAKNDYTGDELHYPVDAKRRVIYNDPVKYAERGERRYPDCSFLSEHSVVNNWGSYKHRFFEFEILPAQPLIDWSQESNFKAGKLMNCRTCRKDYLFEEMVAGLHGEFWVDPKGHIMRDGSTWLINDVPAPSTEPPKDDGPVLDLRLEQLLDGISGLDDILDEIADQPNAVLLALNADNLALYRADVRNYEISDTAVEWLRMMAKAVLQAASDVSP